MTHDPKGCMYYVYQNARRDCSPCSSSNCGVPKHYNSKYIAACNRWQEKGMDRIHFLSHEDVCTLTGAKTKAGQVVVLQRNGIRHTIKRNGWPCVVSAALLPSTADRKPEKVEWQPRKAM